MQELNASLASWLMTLNGGAADSLKGQEVLQRDLDKLEHWAINKGMKFNKNKCQILHTGWNNTGDKHKLGEKWHDNVILGSICEC